MNNDRTITLTEGEWLDIRLALIDSYNFNAERGYKAIARAMDELYDKVRTIMETQDLDTVPTVG